MNKKTNEERKESFEQMCIRTGHKPYGAQGIDGSKYGYSWDGTVYKKPPPQNNKLT